MINYVRRTIQNPAEGLVTSAAITFSTASMLVMTPAKPVRIIRWGTIVTTAPVAGNTVTLKFTGDVWPNANVNTNAVSGSTASFGGSNSAYNASNQPVFYVDTAGGSLTVPVAAITVATATVVIGSVLWHNVNPQAAQDSTGYYPAPDTSFYPPGGVSTQLVIFPGQSFVITCASVGTTTAGAGKMWVEIEEQPFQADYNNNPGVLSGFPTGNISGSSSSIIPSPSSPFAFAGINAQS